MEINPKDIVVEHLILRPDDKFDAQKYTGGVYGLKKFYIAGDEPFSVDLVYSTNPALNHEKIARAYIESDKHLKAKYDEFNNKQYYLVSYKDFLINNQEAASVADPGGRSKAQVVCGDTHIRVINKIVGDYLGKGYKLEEPPTILSSAPGRY